MWPWEHLAVGYLCYSLGARALGRTPPSDAAAAVVAVAALLPDLVDKPLSWGLGWFPSGYAVGHSALVAAPLGAGLLLAGYRRGRPALAVAAVVGYWSHLLADVFDPLRRGEPPLPGRVLWPVSDPAPYGTDYGLGRGVVYLDRLAATLAAAPPADLLSYLLLPAATAALWALDGAPGPGLAVRAAGRVRRHFR